MQSDAKVALGSVILVVVFTIGTALIPALRVLMLPVIFIAMLAVLYWLARPRSED